MANIVFSSAGSTISISAGVPATFNAAGYAALTYTVINEVVDIGTVGKTFAVIAHTPVNTGITKKLKGIAETGQITLTGGRLVSDPGQLILSAAAESREPYAIMVTLADTPATKLYVQGLVMSYQTVVGGAGVITGFSSTVELSGDLIVVAGV